MGAFANPTPLARYMSLERPVPADLRTGFWRDLSPAHAAAALVGFLFAATGPVAVILATGSRGGLAEADLASWVFGAFLINGIVTIVFSLAYRQPLAFFWTIPGTVLVGPALGHFTFAEIVGAYIATGLLMLVLGLTGLVRRATEAVPMPIVMGMVAGVFLQFGLDWVRALDSGVRIAAPMTVVFLLVAAWPALAARLPPLLVALGVGAVAIWALDVFAPGLDQARFWASPQLHVPQLSWAAMLELVVPLVITVLVVQNGQGIAVLTAADETDDTRRAELEAAFKGDLKRRIDETAKYVQPDNGTLPFAFMFIPAEGIYYDLMINEVGAMKVNTRSLIDYAYNEKKVIIVSPTTFAAYLQSVLYGFKAFKVEETAKEIARNVENLSRHLRAYEDYFRKLGASLSTSVNHYNAAYEELAKVDKDVLRITGESPGFKPSRVERPLAAE